MLDARGVCCQSVRQSVCHAAHFCRLYCVEVIRRSLCQITLLLISPGSHSHFSHYNLAFFLWDLKKIMLLMRPCY